MERQSHPPTKPAPASPKVGSASSSSKPLCPEAQTAELVRIHMPLVRQIARRYCHFSPNTLEDLVQVGSIGLLKAIRYYDPQRTKAASFKTLATCYVRGEIRHYLRDQASLVQVPRRLSEITSQILQLEEKLARILDHAPSVNELSSYSGMPVKDILDAQLSWEARVHYESFDHMEDEDREDRRNLSDMVPDRRYQDSQAHQEEHEYIAKALEKLGRRRRQILEFIFIHDLSQKETASVLGLSEMGVSRAVQSGLKKLKEILKTQVRA